jgi:hydroxycarboxylate dehydrogenase B
MVICQAIELRELGIQIFEACGAPPADAEVVSDHLVTSSLMGLDSHGVIRIPEYVGQVRKGAIIPGASLTTLQESDNTVLVDCNWNFGQVSAAKVMDMAVTKAKTKNVAAVVTRHCGHVGRLGAYTEQAARQGLVAMAFCNSARNGHFVQPWGGKQGRLATNPISFAFPYGLHDPIVADFSTAEVPEGVLRVYRNRGDLLPGKWVTDSDGNASDDPNDFYGPPKGAILPFGGMKGYRGYALGLLVEILAGILAGMHSPDDKPGNGLTFVTVNIEAFLPFTDYSELIIELGEYIKSSPAANGHTQVFLPGEVEFQKKLARLEAGIPLDDRTWEEIRAAAAGLGIGALMPGA